jgi:hypothetical protein
VLTLLRTLHAAEPGTCTLVVVPKNVLANWASEFHTWLPDDAAARASGSLTAVHLFTLGLRDGEPRLAIVRSWQASSTRPQGGVLLIGMTLFADTVLAGCPELAAVKHGKAAPAARPVMSEGDSPAAELARLLLRSGDVCVVDEAHELRNADTQLHRALSSLTTQRRVALTGSPLQNKLLEFWTMMDFVRPGDMQTEAVFRKQFVDPIDAGRAPRATAEQKAGMMRALSTLHVVMEAYVQRRGPEILQAELAPKQDTVLRVRPSALQYGLLECFLRMRPSTSRSFGVDAFIAQLTNRPQALHAECLKIEREMLARGVAAAEAAAAAADRQLNQQGADDGEAPPPAAGLASDSEEDAPLPDGWRRRHSHGGGAARSATPPPPPSADDARRTMYLAMLAIFRAAGVAHDADAAAVWCGKTWAVVEAARWCVAHDEKLLIFSESTETLDALQRVLSSCLGWAAGTHTLRIDGVVKCPERQRQVDAFNAAPRGEAPHAFLLTTGAGGMGINLTAATRLLLYDCDWNPAKTAQAIHRIYRYGQARRTFAYRLVMDAWREDDKYTVAARKEALAMRVVDKKTLQHERCAGAGAGGDSDSDARKDTYALPPRPRAPDGAALAAWAAPRDDAMLAHLLRLDAGGAADGNAASSSAAALPPVPAWAAGPWVAALAEHAEVLQEDPTLVLSVEERGAAALQFLEAHQEGPAAGGAGGAPLSARTLRLLKFAQAREAPAPAPRARAPRAQPRAAAAAPEAATDAAEIMAAPAAAEVMPVAADAGGAGCAPPASCSRGVKRQLEELAGAGEAAAPAAGAQRPRLDDVELADDDVIVISDDDD